MEGANLRVEGAQKSYNEVVRQYGPASYEARQANYELQQAILAKKKAEDEAAGALDTMKKKEQEYAKDSALINSAKDKAEAIKGLVDAMAKGDSAATQQKRNAMSPGYNAGLNALKAIGHNATGTDYWQGGLTWVGENGRELVNLPKGSQVIPHQESENIAAGSGGSSPISLTVNVGMYAGMPVEKRQIALTIWRELVRAARAQGQQLPNIGAISVQ